MYSNNITGTHMCICNINDSSMVNNDSQIDISSNGHIGPIPIRGNIVYFKGTSLNTGEYNEYG